VNDMLVNCGPVPFDSIAGLLRGNGHAFFNADAGRCHHVQLRDVFEIAAVGDRAAEPQMRLIDPGSEFRVHRQWFLGSAMDELLGVDYRVAEKDRLYRCLDRLLGHKQGLFVWLKQRWADLFEADLEVFLYDLTSTYFEGEMEQNRKAKRGYSRDGWPDCLQVVIALVITQPPRRITANPIAHPAAS